MRIVFMGTPAAAVPTLEKLVEAGHDVVEVWTQPDRRSGRGKKMTPPAVKVCAEKHGITVFQPEKIKTKDTRARFVGLNADVAVVVAYGRILTKTYLQAFEHGCINVHFSLLPKYRGAAPVNWAIANGETATGVTTMRMDRGLDTGDMLLVREVAIKQEENAIELMDRLAVIGGEVLLETLQNIDELKPIPQEHDAASLAPLFDKSDGIIDWGMDAQMIVNRIRGFQPFPRSFSFLGGERRCIFWRASVVTGTDTGGVSGEVLESDESCLVIACGGGTSLSVDEIQLSGKPRMLMRDFNPTQFGIRKGQIFGNAKN